MPTMPDLFDIKAIILPATAKLGASRSSVDNTAGETDFQRHLSGIKLAIIDRTRASPIPANVAPQATLPAAILVAEPGSMTALASAASGLQKPEQLSSTSTKSLKKVADRRIKTNSDAVLSPGQAMIALSGGIVSTPALPDPDSVSKGRASIQIAPVAVAGSKIGLQSLPTAILPSTPQVAVSVKTEKSVPESAAKTLKSIDASATSKSNPAPPTAPDIVSTGAVVPTLTATVEPAKASHVTTQVANAFAHAAIKNASTILPLHISLAPEHLGNITIKIEHHISGNSTVTITASQPETLETLKHDVPILEHILTNAGLPEANRQIDFQPMPVTATQLNIGFRSSTENQGQGHSSEQNARHAGTEFAYPSMTNATRNLRENATTANRAGVDMIA
jgi:hypothetical protein